MPRESYHSYVYVLISFPHLRYGPDLSFALSTCLVFIAITGSAVLVSLNVDPVLYQLYPFILPLWIATC